MGIDPPLPQPDPLAGDAFLDCPGLVRRAH
jgi:hypothetical protein